MGGAARQGIIDANDRDVIASLACSGQFGVLVLYYKYKQLESL